MAESYRFCGVTRHLLGSFLSPTALADEALVTRVLRMAQDVGRDVFISQQTAILNRRDQSDTLAAYQGEDDLCGFLDELTPIERSREMAALAARADLQFLPKIGHLSSLEAPRAVSDAVIELLQRVRESWCLTLYIQPGKHLFSVMDIVKAQLGFLAHEGVDKLVGVAAQISPYRIPSWQIHAQQASTSGFIVVSLSCAGGISPSPLKRLVSILPCPLLLVIISSRWSSSSAYNVLPPCVMR